MQSKSFKANIEDVIENVRDVVKLCTDIVAMFNKIWESHYSKIEFPETCINLKDTCDPCSFEKLGITGLLHLERQIVQNTALTFVQQPSSVLLKKSIGKLFKNSQERNNDKTSTQTTISFQLTNIFGRLEESADLSLKVQVASAHQADKFINGEADASILTKVGMHSNGILKIPKKSIRVKMSYNIEDSTFHATIPDISISNVCKRTKRDASGQTLGAVSAKYYFVASVIFKYENHGKIIARSRSCPIVIRTHSSQTSDALATASMCAHFGSSSVLFSEPRTTATIQEIGEALHSHFSEWTGGLQLNLQHLESLKEMLLDDIISKQPVVQSRSFLRENIPLANFYFENLNGLPYSQFTWFRETVHMLKFKYLRELYASNHFGAYISTGEAEWFLTGSNGERVPGDFILKFSRSRLCEIGAAFVKPDMGISVYAFQLNIKSEPAFKKSFEENIYLQKRSGGDAFLSLYQHPHNIPKQQVFPPPARQGINRLKYIFSRMTVDV